MGVTLDHILMLAGRLDDAPGFDAPRERFRRFLLEFVHDPATLRSFVEACQHIPGDQHLHALRDLVVLVGRFLGFDVTFSPLRSAGASGGHQGYWSSRSRLRVALEVKSARTAEAALETLIRSVAALPTGTRVAGLSVVPPLSLDQRKVEAAVAAAPPGFPVSVIALDGLLTLAGMVTEGRATHDDVVRLLEFALPMDFVVGLLERSVRVRPDAGAAGAPGSSTERSDHAGSSFWIASVTPDYASTPEEFLEMVVAKRHVFGITDRGAAFGTVRTGDSICLYLPKKGVVGHARVASLMDGGSGIRDARRFRQVLRLEDLVLHLGRPVPPDPETELRLRRAPVGLGRYAQTLVEISEVSYSEMAAPVALAEAADRLAPRSNEGDVQPSPVERLSG